MGNALTINGRTCELSSDGAKKIVELMENHYQKLSRPIREVQKDQLEESVAKSLSENKNLVTYHGLKGSHSDYFKNELNGILKGMYVGITYNQSGSRDITIRETSVNPDTVEKINKAYIESYLKSKTISMMETGIMEDGLQRKSIEALVTEKKVHTLAEKLISILTENGTDIKSMLFNIPNEITELLSNNIPSNISDEKVEEFFEAKKALKFDSFYEKENLGDISRTDAAVSVIGREVNVENGIEQG